MTRLVLQSHRQSVHISHIYPSHSLYSPPVLYSAHSSKSTKQTTAGTNRHKKTLFLAFSSFWASICPSSPLPDPDWWNSVAQSKIAFQLGGFGKSLSVLFCDWLPVLHCTIFCTQQGTQNRIQLCVDVVGKNWLVAGCIQISYFIDRSGFRKHHRWRCIGKR